MAPIHQRGGRLCHLTWAPPLSLSALPTFLQLHGEELQFLHPLLQLVLGRGRHGIHLLVTPVVVLVGVGVEHLEGRQAGEESEGRRATQRLQTKPNSVRRLGNYSLMQNAATLQS